MTADLSKEVIDYLRSVGFRDAEIAEFRPETRIYHDIGAYGDIAESYIEELRNKFNVDISEFIFEEYFPKEFEGKNNITSALIFFFPPISYFIRRINSYKPMTLAMIQNAIDMKRLG
jgi:hypothetical protein